MLAYFTSKPQRLAWAILIILALIWGSSFILIKKGLEVFSPLQTATIRVAASFLPLILVTFSKAHLIPKEKWKYLVIAGLIGIYFPAFLFAFAQTEIKSSLAGVLNSLTPLFTFVAGAIFFQQASTWLKFVGIVIGFVGSLGLILIGTEGVGSGFNAYAFLVIAATIFYGVNVNLIKRYLSDLKPLYVSAFSIATVGPLAIVGLFGTGVFPTLVQEEGGWEAFAYLTLLGVVSTGFAMVLFNRLIQITSPVFASSVTYLIPIVAIAWGLLDGEFLLPAHYACMLLVVVGVWLVNRG